MAEHKCFTVGSTDFRSHLPRKEPNGDWLAIHFQTAPEKTETGAWFGLRFPMMIMANYLQNPTDLAERVAAILNDHWNDPKYNKAVSVKDNENG